MKKEQKRLLILIAIVVAAALFWLYDRQKGSSQKAKTREAAIKSIEETLMSPAATQLTPTDDPLPVSEAINVMRGWGRDPFQPPAGMELFKIKTPDKDKSPQHPAEESLQNVTGIFICGSHKMATIGDMNCCEGDTVGDEKVVEILPDRVILKRGHTKREISLGGESVSVVKEVK